jgi:tetratricopeptide (TPR) repeat protein
MTRTGLSVIAAAIWVAIWIEVWSVPAFSQSPLQSDVLQLDKIQLSIEGKRRSVLFRFSRPPDSIHSFALSSPSRLVVDVKGPVRAVPSGTYPAEDVLLTQVRLGAHPHRLRLVLDLKGSKIPPFVVEQRQALVAIVFTQKNNTTDKAFTQILFSHTKKGTTSPPIRKAALPRAPEALPAAPLTSLPKTPPPRPATPETPPAPLTPRLPDSQSGRTLSSQALAHLEQGQVLYDRGELDKAITEWRETVRLAPANAKAHHLMGLALGDSGEHQRAVSMLQTSLRLDPDNAMAHVHLARALANKGDTQEAIAAYRKALQLVPTSAYIHDQLGHVLASTGDLQAAAQEWQDAVELDPDYAYTHANLGEVLEQLGKKTQALSAYERAVQLAPDASFVTEVRQRIKLLRAPGS